MIITTNVMVPDSVTGQKSFISAGSPQELLKIMQAESIEQCKISIDSMGRNLIDGLTVTKSDVLKWSRGGDIL